MMELFRASPAAVMRRATDLIRQTEASEQAVATLWQTESDVAFRERVLQARERLPANRLLLVVCAPGVVAAMLPGIRVVELAPARLPLFTTPARYRGDYGGRGAGRSWSFARALLVRTLESKRLVLCGREFQNSIAESIHRLLSDQIEVLGLQAFFEVQARTIIGKNGSEFLFEGLRNNISRIKSLEGIDIAFIEEAERISDESWNVLIPTVRKPGSEIWAGFNPDQATDPTYVRFVTSPPQSCVSVKTTHAHNPWFPATLRAEMEYLKSVDLDAFAHVWLGECRQHSEAQILRGKYIVQEFTPGEGWDGPYFGCDFGFSQDPTTLIKCWVFNNALYIEYEVWGIGVDIDRTPEVFDHVPGAREHVIRADSARPETISYLQRHGYPSVVGVEKWGGSVEDGVAHLRSYEKIVIHPRCDATAEEARLYSFRVDRLSGDVLPDVVDKHNHCMDAIRYALAPLIRMNGGQGLIAFMKMEIAKDPAAAAAYALAMEGPPTAEQEDAARAAGWDTGAQPPVQRPPVAPVPPNSPAGPIIDTSDPNHPVEHYFYGGAQPAKRLLPFETPGAKVHDV